MFHAILPLVLIALVLALGMWLRFRLRPSHFREDRRLASETRSQATASQMYRASAIVFHRLMEIQAALDRLNPESRDRLRAKFNPDLSSYFSIEQTAEWTDDGRLEEFQKAHRLLDTMEGRIEIEWEYLKEESRLEEQGEFERAEHLRHRRSTI